MCVKCVRVGACVFMCARMCVRACLTFHLFSFLFFLGVLPFFSARSSPFSSSSSLRLLSSNSSSSPLTFSPPHPCSSVSVTTSKLLALFSFSDFSLSLRVLKGNTNALNIRVLRL